MNRICAVYRELACDQDWLSAEEKQMLDQHLSQCDRCRAEVKLVSRIGTILREEALPEVPADLTDRIMAAVRAEQRPARASALTGVLIWLPLVQIPLLILAGWEPVAARARLVGVWARLVGGLFAAVFSSLAATTTELAAAAPGWLPIPGSDFLLPLVTTLIAVCVLCGLLLYTEEHPHA